MTLPGDSLSEAERTLVELAQRARIAIALGSAGLLAAARQVGGVPDELLARGFLVTALLVLAVAAQEAPSRLGRRAIGLGLGVLADVAAVSLAVVLLADRVDLVPALLLWPIFTAGLIVPELALLLVAALETALLAAVVLVLRPDALSLAQAGGWAGLYFMAAFANGELIRRFRDAQRTTELAFARAADLVPATTPQEVADVLFEFVAQVLSAPSGTPRLLLWDARGEGGFEVAACEGFDAPPAPGAGSATISTPGQGVWYAGAQVASALGVGELARYPHAFVQPLSDGRRLVGLMVLATARSHALPREAQRGLARVAAHAASALARIDLARMVEWQRGAMTALLDTNGVAAEPTCVGAWAVRTAQRVSGARTVALVRRVSGILVCECLDGLSEDELFAQAGRLLEAASRRPAPLFIADTSSDERFGLGPRFARGCLAALPIGQDDAVLLAHDDEPNGFSSSDLQLLIMLTHQLRLLWHDGAPREAERYAKRPA